MQNLITEASRYIMIILIAIYTFDCFFVFKNTTERKKNHIFTRQNVFMFLIHFIAFTVICFETENLELIIFYGFQQVLLFGVMALYRTIYPGINRLLLNNMCMFLSISFIMLTRLSYDKAVRQFKITLISLAVTMVIPYLIKKLKLLRHFGYIYGALGFMALTAVYILGRVTNGAKLSFSIAGITLQPSEFVKILFIFFVAAMYVKSTTFKQIVITSAIAFLHVLVLVLSKDLGGGLIIFITYIMMLYVAVKNPFYLLAGLLSGSIASVIAYRLFAHVRVRVLAWSNPFSVIEDAGYQITQSLFSIGTGGWFGMGLYQGAPTQIPLVETDFIFSAISEELGGIFALCLILIYSSCFIMFINVAMQLKDEFYRLIGLGLGVIFGFQVFLTIGGVIKFIPLTGVTLPLISYGGSSVLSTLIMFSIIQGIYLLKQNEEDSIEKEKKVNKNGKRNRELANVTYIFIGLFICMMGYLVYFHVALSEEVINNSYNTRQDILAKKVVRGKILADDGEILAETVVDNEGNEERVYPFKKLFAHVVGYSTKGKSGIEFLGNINLLRSNAFIMEQLANEFEDKKNIGNNLNTTLNVAIQQAAYDALGAYRGAVVVMEPDTGKILAMVSKPDFDPNQLDAIWDSLIDDEESNEEGILVNRATQGLYPPGSTFKIITSLAYIRENPDYSAYNFNCTGKITEEEMTISCYHNTKHGEVDLKESFAKSCNSSFANIGLQLDPSSFLKTAESVLFNKALPVSLPYNKSYFPITKDSGSNDLMQAAIGQGKTQISPIHLAMITSAIANKGVLMKPYLIDSITSYTGEEVKAYGAETYGNLITEEEAGLLTEFMTEVVNNGTASDLKGLDYQAAGKTGSAQYSNEKTESHAWFTGFAPADDPQVVVTIIVEGAGSGGEYAVPMAKRIFETYMKQNNN